MRKIIIENAGMLTYFGLGVRSFTEGDKQLFKSPKHCICAFFSNLVDLNSAEWAIGYRRSI